MSTQLEGLTEEQKQAWVTRCQSDPGFRDALLVETYVMQKQMLDLVLATISQLGPMLQSLPFGLGGNGKAKA